MPLKSEDIHMGKSYQLLNGTVRKVFEIVPNKTGKRGEVNDKDIVRYEAEKWGYDPARYGGKTRVKIKVREKMHRVDFAKEVSKRLD
ncbi:MAG: hypothetical protein MK052_04455 [Alphaproteobacteria bacterium]|nr:hypothetical protein [Alphaproteobacteria bacterium]